MSKIQTDVQNAIEFLIQEYEDLSYKLFIHEALDDDAEK